MAVHGLKQQITYRLAASLNSSYQERQSTSDALCTSVPFSTSCRHGSISETPLHRALRNGHFNMAKFLVVKGADPNFKNCYGVRPKMLFKVYDVKIDVQ